ncbi:hypothetical protein EDB86DRAFT_3063350 [Lactarius hatsudake]|nr:hypothetical protein EDB86DRAFT_3063350 [Lactarius hatsudake]
MLYISRTIPLLGIGALNVAKTVLSTDTYRDIARTELEAIDHRLAELASGPIDASNVDISMDPPSSERLRTLVQSVFSDPQESREINALFGQGASYSGAAVCRFIRERVAQESFVGYDAQRRILVAKALSESVCLLAHSGDSECLGSASQDLLLLSTYKIAIRQLLRGDSNEITAAVRKWGNQALSYAVRHHPIDLGLEEVGDLVSEMYKFLAHKERAVRLSAGQVLVEIVSYYNRVGQVSWIRAEGVFDKFYELLRDARDPVKETVLITVGRVGRVTTSNFLSVAISCLISRLADPNPALKGIAYMQLMSLARFYGKTPYKLLDPYIGEIARYLITQWPHQPALLLETCRLVSQEPAEFISGTLVHTLPFLFASCNNAVIEKIAQIMGLFPSKLFLDFSKDILTQVFLLPEKTQTDNALEFILQVMPTPSGGSINAQTLVRSCTSELLGTFVFLLGSEDPKKVNEGRKKASSVGGIGRSLKTNILGLISYLVDKLQGVQGRETMAAKQQTLRGFGALVTHVGPEISIVAPQIMATLQVTLAVRELSDVTLDSWFVFLKTLDPRDSLAHAGTTSASLASFWKSLSPHGRDVASSILRYLVLDIGNSVDPDCLHDVVDLSGIEALSDVQHRLHTIRRRWTVEDRLHRLLERVSSDSLTVTLQALKEIKSLLDKQRDFFQSGTSGDSFNTLIGRTLRILSSVAGRDVDGIEDIRLIAFECIGAIGALDPDRLDLGMGDSRPIVLKDFTEEEESILFTMHLIRDVLVSAFRSTSDMGYQTNLAYAIQEMLKFCQFDVSLMSSGRYTTSASLKARTRWDSLPKHVLETITPLLESRYTIKEKPLPAFELPIYPQQGTYREWLQQWTTCLISEAEGVAQRIFEPFRSVVRNKDVGVAHHLLPHLVLHTLVSGDEDKMWNIQSEILAVLKDQVNEGTSSSADKKLLSAQVVFMLLDHLNKWARLTRKDLGDKKGEAKRSRGNRFGAAEQLSRIDSILSSVDQDLMAKAAFQCKAYARSLMSFERHLVTLRQRNADSAEIQSCYERLHEIYCNLDEPDGMEGISTLILSPTLEHQIRQHESTGRWTSAQSCWELRLQQSPDNLEYHIGLLRCLRNLGHYDTLRTHVKGVLTRNPDWKQSLVGFEVESAWMIGDWNDVQVLVDGSGESTPSVVIASLLLAIREGDPNVIADALARARMTLGNPIAASGGREYRHTYEAVLNLHLVHEVELIHRFSSEQVQMSTARRVSAHDELTKTLNTRLNSTLPSFRTLEPILSVRRTAYGISLTGEIGRSWLISAKIARKAGHWQTAYSAILQAQESRTTFSLMQKVRLLRATGEPLRALQELTHYLQTTRVQDNPLDSDVIEITEDESEVKQQKARAELLRARWMEESDRYEISDVHKVFQQATELWQKWESGMFYYGKYQDRCFDTIPPVDLKIRGLRMRLSTVRCFTKAMKYGNKFIYQTVPRLLTIWLDMGEDATVNTHEYFIKISAEISRAISGVPAFKWYTAFPQIASRVGHKHDPVFEVLARLISTVIKEFPQQTLWLFASVVKSRNKDREKRGKSILEKLKSSCTNESTHVKDLVNASVAMVDGLLALCDFSAPDPPRNLGPDAKTTLSMKRDIPQLSKLMPSPLIVPLQESLTVILPPTSAATNSLHQPFRLKYPDIQCNGQTYAFLGKPKDDLRKDARLMDFNSIINKILNMNSDSRRRQLHIRTYGVVTLNEECGFIQWVPDTVAMRHVLNPLYEARGQKGWGSELSVVFEKIRKASDIEAGKIFANEVLPLQARSLRIWDVTDTVTYRFTPVFHEWFLETFPEPSAWLASRLVYSRSAAVTSMIGFILGLGDRHCENILLDTNTGSVVHVDFNCLFEKGKTLEVPERVPFRLTQNILDGLGVFRIACEITMGLLRENKDTLMTVLDPFIHDPLVEWEDERRKIERQTHRRNAPNKPPIELRVLAKGALSLIEKKLRGIYRTSKDRVEKEVSTGNLVQMLIQEATDNANLGKMYPGWAPWQ